MTTAQSFNLDERTFVFWKTLIAASLRLWRLKIGEITALEKMQQAQKAVPALYASMVNVPTEKLSDWPNILS
jgi:hypothetical protein